MSATKRFELNGYQVAVRQAAVKCRLYDGVTSVARVGDVMAISIRPERAVKKAMQRATAPRGSRLCVVCNCHMRDDVECYRRECDDRVLLSINGGQA
jgi:hypothetical protein